MKKLLIFVLLLIVTSCGEHLSYPLVIDEIEIVDNEGCTNISSKYRIRIKRSCYNSNEVYIFTNQLFQIGDTIR